MDDWAPLVSQGSAYTRSGVRARREASVFLSASLLVTPLKKHCVVHADDCVLMSADMPNGTVFQESDAVAICAYDSICIRNALVEDATPCRS
jgi:hypothetical protein